MDHLFTFAGVLPFMGGFGGAVVPTLVTIYVVARWRGYREGIDDPQLGRKLAAAVFCWLALQLLLAGLSVLGYAVVGGADDREPAMRIAAALVLPALLVGGLNLAALRRTNHVERPLVVRMVAGLSLIQTGIVATLALVLACVLSLLKEPDASAAGTAWSVAAVYGVAWAAQGRSLS